ncbi:MAG: T9SS type A sorting domain-containing protein [Bacteroidetes bacterium]|nr:T9SS type A sorting domain-containing protein [Bacteroidota bacterium]
MLRSFGGISYTDPRPEVPAEEGERTANTNTVGINETIIQHNITVFPNPANESVNIAYKVKNGEPLTVVMRDALGRIVYTGKVKANETLQIPMNTISNGVYMLKVHKGKETFYQSKVGCIK